MLKAAVTIAAALVAVTTGAGAAEFEVKMLNQSPQGRMVYEPPFLKIAPGDTIKFVPTDPSHNAETIPSMLPEGAKGFKGPFSTEFTQTFDAEGVYGIKCMPHVGMGMVMLVAVGTTYPNLDAAKAVKQSGPSKKKFEALFKQLDEQKAASAN
jgi:pseudoazurin